MSRALRHRWCLAIVAVSALALSACGGDSPPVAEPRTAPATSAPPTLPPPPPGTGQPNGELVVGTLLPTTGDLSALGPPEIAAVHLAVRDINAAGGVLAKPVKFFDADSGDSKSNIAARSVDRLFLAKSDVIIGAASSSVSLTVLDKITSAGVLQFSPANTSVELTAAADRGLYFWTAPSDVLQATVLAREINGDGNGSLSILEVRHAYGAALADRVEQVFKQVGGEVKDRIPYDPAAEKFSGEVGRIVASNPDAIVIIGFQEAARIVPELVKQGIGPATKKIYFVDANLSNNYTLLPGTLTGVKGTLPGAQASAAFRARMLRESPILADFSYAPEAYDATVLTALAAVKAGSDSGFQMAQQLVGLSRDGEKCLDYAACKKLLEAGRDIDYDGVSGPIEFDPSGDPKQASIGIYQYGPDNKFTFAKAVKGSLE